MMGQCKYGSSCSFSHDLNSTPETICQYYLNGECRYGDHCRYIYLLNYLLSLTYVF